MAKRRSQKVTLPINSLSGGVGRTPPSKRQLNEAQQLDNCLVTLEKSLEKRNGFKFVQGTIQEDSDRDGALDIPLSSSSDDIHFSWLNLDEDERFLIAINSSSDDFDDLITVFKVDENSNVTKEIVDTSSISSTDQVSFSNYIKDKSNEYNSEERLKTIPFGSSMFILNKRVNAGFVQGFPGEDITYLTARNVEGGEKARFETTIAADSIGNIDNFRSLVVTWTWTNNTLTAIAPEADASLKSGSFTASIDALTFTNTSGNVEVNYPRTAKDVTRSLYKDLILFPKEDSSYPFETARLEVSGTDTKIIFESEENYDFSISVASVESAESSGPVFSASITPSRDGQGNTTPIAINKDIRSEEVLGQSVQNFSKIPLPPAADDDRNVNGANNHLATISGETGSTAGFGKIWYTRESFGSQPSGYYRTVDVDREPFFERVRTQDGDCMFDKVSMPIILDYVTAENKWVLKYPDWKLRTSGTKETNKGPLVFENGAKAKITDMCVWRNRLWFASDDTLFSSASNDYFNLWLNDPDNIVDTDPIDVRTGSAESSSIASITPFKDFIFVNTLSDTQYELLGSENQITPFTAKLAPSSFYSTAPLISPVTMGSQVYFFAPHKLFLYFSSSAASVNQAVEVSKHAEGYLPKEISTIEALPNKDMIIMVDKEFQNHLYVYVNRWEGDRAAQNAFFRWILPQNSKVLNIKEYDNEIFITVARSWTDAYGTNPRTSIFIQKMNMNSDGPATPRTDRRSVERNYFFEPNSLSISPDMYVTYATIDSSGQVFTGQADFFEWSIINEGADNRKINAYISDYTSEDNFLAWEDGDTPDYYFDPAGSGYELFNSGSLDAEGTFLDRTRIFSIINKEKLKNRYDELCVTCDETVLFENEIIFEDITDPDNPILYKRPHRIYVNRIYQYETCPYGNTPGAECCPEGTLLAGYECPSGGCGDTESGVSHCNPYGFCDSGDPAPMEGCCPDGFPKPCCCEDGSSDESCQHYGGCGNCPDTVCCGCQCDDTCCDDGSEPPCCPQGSAAAGEGASKFGGVECCPCSDGTLPCEFVDPDTGDAIGYCCQDEDGNIGGRGPCCPEGTLHAGESCKDLGCGAADGLPTCCCCDGIEACNAECDNGEDVCPAGTPRAGLCPQEPCGCDTPCSDNTCPPCINEDTWPSDHANDTQYDTSGTLMGCNELPGNFSDYYYGGSWATTTGIKTSVSGWQPGAILSKTCTSPGGIPTCHTGDCISNINEFPQTNFLGGHGPLFNLEYPKGWFCPKASDVSSCTDCTPSGYDGSDDIDEYYRKASHWFNQDTGNTLRMRCSVQQNGVIGYNQNEPNAPFYANGHCRFRVFTQPSLGPIGSLEGADTFAAEAGLDPESCYRKYDFFKATNLTQDIVLYSTNGETPEAKEKTLLDWAGDAFDGICKYLSSSKFGKGLYRCGMKVTQCGVSVSNPFQGPAEVYSGPIKALWLDTDLCRAQTSNGEDAFLNGKPLYYKIWRLKATSYLYVAAKNIQPAITSIAFTGCPCGNSDCNSTTACGSIGSAGSEVIQNSTVNPCTCGSFSTDTDGISEGFLNRLYFASEYLPVTNRKKRKDDTRSQTTTGNSYNSIKGRTTYTENVVLGEIPETKDKYLEKVLQNVIRGEGAPFVNMNGSNYLGRLYSGPQEYINSRRDSGVNTTNDKGIAWHDSRNIPTEVEKTRNMTIGKWKSGTAKSSTATGYSFTIQYSHVYMGNNKGRKVIQSFPKALDNNENYRILSRSDGRSFIELSYHNPNIFEIVLGENWEGVGDFKAGDTIKCYNYSYGPGYARYEIDDPETGTKFVSSIGTIEGEGSPKTTVLELLGINQFMLPPYSKVFIDYGSITDSSTDTQTLLRETDIAYDQDYIDGLQQFNQLDCGTINEPLESVNSNLFIYDIGTIENNATYLLQDFVAGENFSMAAMISPPTFRDQNNNTIEGVMKVLSIDTRHFNTGKYRLNVLDRGAIVSTVLHSPRSQRKILGIDPLYEKTLGTDYQGEFTQKVFLNANDCFISITSNSPDPVNITNIQLNATFSPRKRSSSEV